MTPAPEPLPVPPAADRPAHYRLSTGTWDMIVKEYREGATAPFLARKWRVSEHAIRKRVTQHGATKRDWGDAQAIGQALAREAELEEARRNAPEAVAARLFAGLDLDADEEGDPGALARTAVLASGRAMKGRLWAEARALAGLAETYARLESRAVADRKSGMTIETVDIRLLAEILMHPHPEERLAAWNVKPDTPEFEVSKAYWAHRTELNRLMKVRDDARTRYRDRLIDIIHTLGGKAPEPPDVAIEGIWVGDGLEEADERTLLAEDLDPYGSGW
jgi:hypothetical protein